MATSKSGAPKKRRSPISRVEGERRLIEAAIQLVRERPFSEVRVREIAQVADVNHGFVHTWFGSKNDLLLRVVEHLLQSIALEIRKAPPGQQALNPFHPDVVLAVRLAMWLNLEGAPTSGVFHQLRVIDELTDRFIKVEGIDPSIARAAATQAASLAVSAASFADMLHMENSSEATDMFDLWRYIVKLLAKHPPA